MPPADRTAWERLGRLLSERRTQISPRYANRRAFAADREMNWRTLHDIEQAKRDNFGPATMRAFETAYMLAPGSLARTLADGDLEPLPPAAPPEPEPERWNDEPQDDAAWDLFPDDETKRKIWRATASLKEPDRARIMRQIDRDRAALAPRSFRSEAGLALPEGFVTIASRGAPRVNRIPPGSDMIVNRTWQRGYFAVPCQGSQH
jgi:hypothetical protein